jgi:hypothetical protein
MCIEWADCVVTKKKTDVGGLKSAELKEKMCRMTLNIYFLGPQNKSREKRS